MLQPIPLNLIILVYKLIVTVFVIFMKNIGCRISVWEGYSLKLWEILQSLGMEWYLPSYLVQNQQAYSCLSNNRVGCNKRAGWKNLLYLGDCKNQKVFKLRVKDFSGDKAG